MPDVAKRTYGNFAKQYATASISSISPKCTLCSFQTTFARFPCGVRGCAIKRCPTSAGLVASASYRQPYQTQSFKRIPLPRVPRNSTSTNSISPNRVTSQHIIQVFLSFSIISLLLFNHFCSTRKDSTKSGFVLLSNLLANHI